MVMGRISSRGQSYNFRIRKLSYPGEYEISWVIDSYHGRIRYPHTRRRVTNEVGAKRFAKKHDIEFNFMDVDVID